VKNQFYQFANRYSVLIYEYIDIYAYTSTECCCVSKLKYLMLLVGLLWTDRHLTPVYHVHVTLLDWQAAWYAYGCCDHFVISHLSNL